MPLVFADRSVHRVEIGELIGAGDGLIAVNLTGQLRKTVAQVIHDFIARLNRNGFVVMTGIIIPAIGVPVIVENFQDRKPSLGQNVQPEQNGPQAIFFAHVV